jgi:outer membrane protein assembly factor BamB
MARSRASLVYIGVKGHVIAFDRKNGTEIWRVPLPAKYKSSADFVNIFRDADGLFATCAGEIFALDPRTGAVLWHDPLKKLGTGLITVATELGGSAPNNALAQASAVLEAQRQQQAAATVAATSAAV